MDCFTPSVDSVQSHSSTSPTVSSNLPARTIKSFNLDLDGFKDKLRNDSRNFIRFASHNARSLPSSHSFYVDLFSSAKITAFSVTETWLKPTIPSKQVEIAGFRLFRNDRVGGKKKHGGGVGIYVKTGIKAKVILSSTKGSDFEYLFLELTFSGVNLIFGVVYRPPWSSFHDFTESFGQILTDLSSSYSRIIISGDFNVNINDVSSSSSALLSLIDSYSLTVIPSDDTCHSLNSRSSRIDLMLVSDSESVGHLFQSSVAGISDHDMLAIDYRIRNIPSGLQTYTSRKIDNIDLSSLLSDASCLPWHEVYEQTSVDGKMSILNTFLSDLLDLHAPVQTFVVKEPCASWVNADIRNAFRLRDRAHRKWRSSRSNSDWYEYCRLRNHTVRLIRSAKKLHSETKLDYSLGPRVLWKNVRQLGLMDSNHNTGSDQFTSTELNNYFTSIQANNFPSTNEINDVWHHQFSFSFSNIFPEDIVKSVNKISSNAVGVDGIPIKFIKMLLPVISPVLCYVFNYMIMSSTFPSLWKVGHVIPVAKVNAPTTVKDFRPISLLPSLSKAFEHILNDQITMYLDSRNLLNPFQSGFRKHCGTTTALVKIVDDLKLSMTTDQFSVLVLLDFSKAFDSINHQLLIEKLYNMFGFESCAVSLIKSYLNDRSQYVDFDNIRSEALKLSCGVPQGSILGPLLFSLFINDLPSALNGVNFHMYADDVQLYASSKIADRSALVELMNSNIRSVTEWTIANGLLLNATKTQAIKVCKKSVSGVLHDLPKIMVGDTEISYSNVVKNLGLYLDQHLDFHAHINMICKSVFGKLHCLNRLRFSTPLNVRRGLFDALLLPHFLYCDIIYSATSVGIFRRLQLAFNSCLRYVLDLKKYDHISQYSTFLLGCDLSTYFNVRAATFLFKILKYPTPSYLLPYRSLANSERTSNVTVPTYPRGSHFDSSFRVRASTIWNNIQPHHIKRSTSLASFKSSLLCSLLEQQ